MYKCALNGLDAHGISYLTDEDIYDNPRAAHRVLERSPPPPPPSPPDPTGTYLGISRVAYGTRLTRPPSYSQCVLSFASFLIWAPFIFHSYASSARHHVPFFHSRHDRTRSETAHSRLPGSRTACPRRQRLANVTSDCSGCDVAVMTSFRGKSMWKERRAETLAVVQAEFDFRFFFLCFYLYGIERCVVFF